MASPRVKGGHFSDAGESLSSTPATIDAMTDKSLILLSRRCFFTTLYGCA